MTLAGPDSEEKLVYLVSLVQLEMLAPTVNLENLELMEHQVQLDFKDLRVIQDYQVHQESVEFQDILDDQDVME